MLPFINRFPQKPLVYNVSLENGDLPAGLRRRALPRAAARFLAPGRRCRRRQPAAGRADGVAAFLGDPDPAVRADPDVLHRARAGARGRQGQGAAHVLRAAAGCPPTRGRGRSSCPTPACWSISRRSTSWDGNQIDFRAAMAIKPDRRGRDLRRRSSPRRARRSTTPRARSSSTTSRSPRATSRRCPTRARLLRPSCRPSLAHAAHHLARPGGGLAGGGRREPPPFAVQQRPPRVIVSNSPAILVPIDGAPVLQPAGDSALPARHQHARADPAGRAGRRTSTCMCTTAG